MKLEDVLAQDHIFPDLGAREKRALLDELIGLVAARERSLDRGKVLEVVFERERLGSTGIGHGVAIPHGKIAGLDRIIVVFGRSRRGIDFQSTDERPAHIFFLILAPEGSTAAHLNVLAAISGILKDEAFRNRLINASGADEIYRAIVEADRERLQA